MSNTKYHVVSLALICVLITGCAKKEAQRPSEKAGQTQAAKASSQDQVQHKVLAFNLEGLTDKGTKNWDVTGESAESISENEIKLDNIVAKAYGEEACATITANEGIYDRSRNNVRLEKNVKATIENAEGFSGEFIDIPDEAKAAAKSSPTDEPNKKAKTVIVCDGEVLFDYQKNYGYFNSNVRVTSDDGNIDADRITVTLDPMTKKVSQIEAFGNVKIARGQNTTYSDKAVYIEAEKKVILTGQPKIVIYQEGDIKDSLAGQ